MTQSGHANRPDERLFLGMADLSLVRPDLILPAESGWQ
jgi:hypothetical protein